MSKKDIRDRSDYYRNNKKKLNLRARIWNLNNPERRKVIARKANYIKNYGITLDDAEKLLIDQNSKCAICYNLISFGGRSGAHLDHDHKSKLIRGVLCKDCNIGLGAFKDNITILFGAINYIKDFRKKKFTLLSKTIDIKHIFVNPFEKVS